jgi:hypothetical protein
MEAGRGGTVGAQGSKPTKKKGRSHAAKTETGHRRSIDGAYACGQWKTFSVMPGIHRLQHLKTYSRIMRARSAHQEPSVLRLGYILIKIFQSPGVRICGYVFTHSVRIKLH